MVDWTKLIGLGLGLHVEGFMRPRSLSLSVELWHVFDPPKVEAHCVRDKGTNANQWLIGRI